MSIHRYYSLRGEEKLFLRSINGGENEEFLEFVTSLEKPAVKNVIVTGVGSKLHKAVIEDALNVQ